MKKDGVDGRRECGTTEWGSTPTAVNLGGVGQLRQGMKNGEEYVIFEEWIHSLLSRIPEVPSNFYDPSIFITNPMRLVMMLN